ncbi:hypothetical protein MTR67_033407 [Solanum verrucosum]|uniref:Vesicle transport protein n=1 Tax=Solanum verrucosum TaxID=315347 RepID=A0AAF0ZI47_SOLVR|nr:hypothetical protein MTR67_033407 [Solanum verrucosum]
MQKWFSAGSGGGDDRYVEQQQASSSTPSLLADWNSYASAKSSEESSSTAFIGSFDLESAVRSANDTVSGTFNVRDPSFRIVLWPTSGSAEDKERKVSKGVRDIPGNLQSATSNIPSGKALMYFGLFMATGVFFIFMAFTLFLPVIVLVPQKFAICFTLGCSFIIGSFFALKGPKTQFAHMFSMERLPFTLGFMGSMIGTLYVSMALHSYILSALFSVIQVLALAYYAISYFPGGSAGLKFLSSSMISSVLKCFGS